MSRTRRDLLRWLGIGVASGVAGCSGPSERSSLAPDRGPFSRDTLDRAKSVAKTARKAVVTVVLVSEKTLGTGWHIGDGYVVTNAHNVQTDTARPRLEVGTYPGHVKHEATLLGSEESTGVDLALLEAPIEAEPALSYSSSTSLSADQPLVSVGHPSGIGTWVTMLGSFHDYMNTTPDGSHEYFSTFTPNTKGASGSPTLTLDGTVVGCLFGGRSIAPGQALDEVHTDIEAYPPLTLHTATEVFEDYLSQWR